MKNSERALGAANGVAFENAPLQLEEYPRDPYDRDRLREEWRLAAMAWAAAEDEAERLSEARKVLLDDMALRLSLGGKSLEKARMMARTSQQFAGFLDRLHAARLKAREAKIVMENADRLYWASVNMEANQRTERRMSG